MNIDGVAAMLERFGQTITLRRVTGVQRVPFDVPCRAIVTIGAGAMVVGDVQDSADRIVMTSLEWDAAQMKDDPHHGDMVIYEDGRTTSIQGRPEVRRFDDGVRVFIINTMGG